MKKVIVAFIFLTSCSHVPSLPTLTIQRATERTSEPLVARFEPSVPPPPSAQESMGNRSPASHSRKVKPLSEGEIENLLVQVNDNKKDSLIRSNPAHFWAWMNLNAPESLKDIIEFQGEVTADPHFFNFGDVHGKDKSGLALVDVDDSGVGSLYLDFVRYAVFVKAYLKADITKELLDAYKDGLQKDKKDTPQIFKDAFAKSRSDLLKEHAEWVQKRLKEDYKLNNKELKIKGLKDLTKDISDAGETLSKLLLKNHKAKAIYDIGYKVEDSGSSRGMPRYWFSLSTMQNNLSIYECKQLADPATAYYTAQKNSTSRISEVLKIYSDAKAEDSFVFPVANVSYWCRPKGFDFVDRDMIENNRKNLEQMTKLGRYFANWIGLKQSALPEGPQLLKALEEFGKKDLLEETSDLITNYETEVFKLGDKK